MGFPIRTSRDHSFIASSPTLFAGLHVLRRLSSPRHPPDALIHLTLSFQELLWLCLTFRWQEHQTWISYFDKAYCLLCLNPAFCLSGLSRYNHHPNTAPVFLFLFRRQLTVCNRSIIKNRHIVFVCWFRLSNLLKIDAFNIAIYFANQNELTIIAVFLFPSNRFTISLLFRKKESSYTAFFNSLWFGKYWWRQTGSNRWPPACKAGALPTELCPRSWWVWEDLNLRPHAYQACALTSWATNPDSLLKRILSSLKHFSASSTVYR